MKWGGRQSEWRFGRPRFLRRGNPACGSIRQLRRIPAEMRAELTSAEIAMSGSYFDDVLRDPRRYSH
jgi:hypothetical protein